LHNRHTDEVLVIRRRRRNGDTILLQSALLRVVVAIGTITGRYQGTEWPGAPSRCTGAPYVED
jgi:hypothetical protein